MLEVGCGTGQLTNFLGISCRRVIGADMCLNSLRLGEAFRREHGLSRVRFVQMNLFRPCFKPEQFDVILCNGVLHHTADPYGGFQGLVPLLQSGRAHRHRPVQPVRPLLHGPAPPDLPPDRRPGQVDRPVPARAPLSESKREAWFADQYRHPHESKHTIDEVLHWFERAGLQFVRGIPSTVPGPQALAPGTLLDPVAAGSRLDHLLVQLKQVVTGSREGGFFLMIGRKPAEDAASSASAPRRQTSVTRRDKPESVVA